MIRARDPNKDDETIMSLYDTNTSRTVAETRLYTRSPVKHVIWSPNAGAYCAMLTKFSVIVCDKLLRSTVTISEQHRIKSACWIVNPLDGVALLVYSTHTHCKYVTMNGDTGVLCSLSEPMYLCSAALLPPSGAAELNTRAQAVALNTQGRWVSLPLNLTEPLFKLAIRQQQNSRLASMLPGSASSAKSVLQGHLMLPFLQRAGFPELSLPFVQDDPVMRFWLAVECGSLQIALEAASTLKDERVWNRLGEEALQQGAVDIAESSFSKAKNIAKLAHLFGITGQREKLLKLQRLAQLSAATNPQSAELRLTIAAWLGDRRDIVQLLRDSGNHVLGLVCAAVCISQVSPYTPVSHITTFAVIRPG